MSMSMTYIQLIQQCTLAIWGGGVTLNFYLLLERMRLLSLWTRNIKNESLEKLLNMRWHICRRRHGDI